MIEKLFESLDEKVFTPEMKDSLTESFNEAVEAKATELSEAKIEEKVAELSESAEEYKKTLLEEVEAKEAVLLENVDTYLEKVVADFVVEAKEQLDSSLENEKADLMIEAFDAMLTAGGVEVSKIVEAKDSEDVETKLAESIEKYDVLIDDNIALIKENEDLIKMGVIAELSEGLSIVEAEKFAKLAELVEFSKDSSYGEKLDMIKESVKGTKETEVATDVVVEKVNESKSTYSHLI